MSESQYDYLDRVVNTHISECNGELPRLSFEKELERQRLAEECCADTIQKEIDRLAAVSVLPLYLSPRFLAKRNGGWSAAISERMRPFEGTTRMPLYPSPRFLEEEIATIESELTELAAKDDLEFNKIIDGMNSRDLLVRKKDQVAGLIEQLF